MKRRENKIDRKGLKGSRSKEEETKRKILNIKYSILLFKDAEAT